MEVQIKINYIESDLSDVDNVSILQTEDGNASDIRINYSSDVSSVGTIIYDKNLRNDGDNQANPHWKKVLPPFFIFFLHICVTSLQNNPLVDRNESGIIPD